MSQTDHDLERFRAACDYPGVIDEQAVERELASYLRALDIRRQIVRLRPGWRLDDHPPLRRHVDIVLDAWVQRHPEAAPVRDALTAGDGVNREDVNPEELNDVPDDRGPATSTRHVRKILDAVVRSASGEARQAYDAFDRRYAAARRLIRHVPGAVIGVLFFPFLIGGNTLLAGDPRVPLVGLLVMFVMASAMLVPVTTFLVQLPSAVKANGAAAFRPVSLPVLLVVVFAFFVIFFVDGGDPRTGEPHFSFLIPFALFAAASATLASIITARIRSAIKADAEASLQVWRWVLPAVSLAVFIAFVMGVGKHQIDFPRSSFFGPFFVIAISVSVCAYVMTALVSALARMPSAIKARDEAPLMARFAASTARMVNKFHRVLSITSRRRFAAWCIQTQAWDLSEKAAVVLEARWLGSSVIMAWARPLFEAFAAGCWLIY